MPFYSWSDMVKDTEPNETLPAGMTRRGVRLGNMMFGLHESGKSVGGADQNDGPKSHAHESEQITYVFEGRIRMRVGDEEKELGPGEFAYIPSNVEHGGKALTDYVLALDIWSPPRPDVERRLAEISPDGAESGLKH